MSNQTSVISGEADAGPLAGDSSRGWFDVHPVVFWSATVVIFLILAISVGATEVVGSFFDTVQHAINRRFGWFYILSMTGFLFFALWLLQSRYGSIRLGGDDARPEFSRLTWFAMLFSAGIGIGLLFYGVAEPIMHYDSPPTGQGHTLNAARQALALTFFHWGIHGWAVYAIVGLAFAYFGYRRNLPLSLRSAFYPLIGEKIYGWPGDLIDTLAVISTLFGVATSLGIGAMQVNAGLSRVAGAGISITSQIVIIAFITAIATASVVSGLHVGIRRLSELNMALAGLLMLFVFLAGPSAFILNAFVENLGSYLSVLASHSFWTASFSAKQSRDWLDAWTIFYWAWWIAWAPFVGMFIARVSKGRTIREFLTAVLIAPSLTAFIWFTVFGDTALYMQIYGAGGISEIVSSDMTQAIFVVLERYPFAQITGVVCTCCIILFFVTSSDSASLVVDTIASGGKQNPTVAVRVYWALLEGVVAAVLLLAGGLSALQTATITTALPFCVVIIATCVALVRGLRTDPAFVGGGAPSMRGH